MSDLTIYEKDVEIIKRAILASQYNAAKSVNENQLALYYGIGRYISENSRKGFWGKGTIDLISERLQAELPGLRGFTARNLRNMRSFYEAWSDETYMVVKNEDVSNLEIAISKLELMPAEKWKSQFPNYDIDSFLSIGFTHHCHIISKCKDRDERLFYIQRCSMEHYSVDELDRSIASDDFHHQGMLPNNFSTTLSPSNQALKAISTFKDEYLLDYINVEELDIRDSSDIDEKVVEKAIIHNVKNFILTFGKDFAFIKNQYHLDEFGEDQYIDLLFFNRALNCLVAVELKKGKFKTSYLGQLQGYLSILDGFEKKPHENPSIGIILCKDLNKSFVDYVIQDYNKPMGVATYKTSKDMSDELKKALPDLDDLRNLLKTDDDILVSDED